MLSAAYIATLSMLPVVHSLYLSVLQMVFSEYIKLRILYHCNKGFKPYTIVKLLLEEEGITVSRFGVAKFLKVYHDTGTTARRPGSGRLSKVTQHVKELVEQQMEKDGETTAYQLLSMLTDNGIEVSLRTILRCRTSLGGHFGEVRTVN